MKNRNPAFVLLVSLITFGIYLIVWFVSTKREMVKKGADIPTSVFLIIPLLNIFWFWKYAEGVDFVTRGKMPSGFAFLLVLLFTLVSAPVFQIFFNELNEDDSQFFQEENKEEKNTFFK